jgi:hypothetical protein
VTGARSVLRRYADAWHQAARRRRQGQQAGFPRRKHALVPVRFYYGTFQLDGRRVRLPVAKGCPELWVRLARPIPYPAEQVRAVTLLAEGGRLWLAITAAMPVEQHDLDPGRVAGVDLGIIHPYAVITEQAALLVSGQGVARRGLAPSARPAGPAGQGGQTGTQAGAAGLAALAPPPRQAAAGGGPASPTHPPSSACGRQAGGRLRRPAAGGDPAGG